MEETAAGHAAAAADAAASAAPDLVSDPPPVLAVATSGAAAAVSAPTAATPVSVVSTEPRSSERGSRAKRGRPPFRLCFIVPGVAGRSTLPPACMHAAPASAVAGKFYSREEEKIRSELQRIVDAEEAERAASGSDPAEQRRGKDVLESSRYGRYPRPLVAPKTGDRRLHFAYRTSDMVRVQCAIARAAALAAPAGSPGPGTGGQHGRGRQAAVAASAAAAAASSSTAAIAVAAAAAAAAAGAASASA